MMKRKELLDESGSIPERNNELEQRLLNKLYADYVNKYMSRIERLEDDDSFVRDDSYNGVKALHHIMYKYKIGDEGETYICSDDGCRAYEFLVEFDIEDPGYGIYYGCKGLIKGMNQEREIDELLKEWERLKDAIFTILNNTFPDMDFSDRWQSTNNANNRTFWPFWFALQEGEDVVDVAGRATKLIGNVYKRVLVHKEKFMFVEDYQKKAHEVLTYYTEDAYYNCLKKINSKYGEEAVTVFKNFICNAEAAGIIKRDLWYEKCWQFKGLNNNIVAFLLVILFLIMSRKKDKNGLDVETYKEEVRSRTAQIPWDIIIPVFRSENGDYSQIKKSYSAAKISGNYKNINGYCDRAWEVFLKIFPRGRIL